MDAFCAPPLCRQRFGESQNVAKEKYVSIMYIVIAPTCSEGKKGPLKQRSAMYHCGDGIHSTLSKQTHLADRARLCCFSSWVAGCCKTDLDLFTLEPGTSNPRRLHVKLKYLAIAAWGPFVSRLAVALVGPRPNTSCL